MSHDTQSYIGRMEDGQAARVTTGGGRITELTLVAGHDDLPLFLPVLVDAQQNGAFGVCYYEIADRGADMLADIATLLRRHGVGRCQLTIPTCDFDDSVANYRVLDKLLDADGSLSALYFSIFHEGNFMSPQDGWRGAHMAKWLEHPDYDRFLLLDEASGGRIRTVNVAPEEPGGLEFVERAAADGRLVAMGHCCPDAETVAEAVARGARWVTHFGNGAAPRIHRFRNPFWSFMAHEELTLSVICDGFHLPPDVVKTAMLCRSGGNCIPVSDASAHSGAPAGRYLDHGGQPFVVESNGFIHLEDSELLHGAWFQQDRCVEYLVQNLGMDLLDAWNRCSRVPARILGVALPELAVGEEASFVLARWQDDSLQIEQSVHLGVPYLETPIRTKDR